MEEYLDDQGLLLVLAFDKDGELAAITAEGTFAVTNGPAELIASLPPRKGRAVFAPPAQLKQFFSEERLEKMKARTKADAAERWAQEIAANRPHQAQAGNAEEL